MIDLNKYVANGSITPPLHSSGYAEAANAGHLGSVDSRSFEERMRIERSRQHVAGYNRSTIGQSYGVMRARPAMSGTRTSMRPRASLPIQARGGGHSAPPRRAYDPYA